MERCQGAGDGGGCRVDVSWRLGENWGVAKSLRKALINGGKNYELLK